MNNDLITLFSKAKSVLIVIGKTAKLDSLAAGLALQLALVSQGKSAKVCSESQISEDSSKLIGVGTISKTLDLGGNVLKVSFPYVDGSIDKVTYNITDDRFNLLIEPRAGQAPLKNNDVQSSYTGAEVDVIVIIDVANLESLGDLYLENPDVFVREKLVNIDRRFDNQQFGVHNLVEKQFSSTSEIIVKLLQGLRWDLNPDIATNLYTGLVASTNNFTSFSTNAQSFEVASYLLKSGARKIPLSSLKQNLGPAIATGPASFNSSAPVAPIFQNQPPIFSSGTKPVENKPVENKPTENSPKKQPPQDWLKPKIFKSTDLV